jgi:hypothetical protein
MDSDLQRLIDLTTIVKVDDNVSQQIIFGDEHFASRYQRNQELQIDLSTLERNWDTKWRSFGELGRRDRRNYRFLYDSFKLFYFSFEQLRFNKIACVNESLGNKFKMLHFNELTGVNLYGMYHHGKKCIDLLKELRLIDRNHNDREFLKKFGETRNKLIEHNYNPYGLSLQIEPSIWSLASTNSCLEVHIHKPNGERDYDAYVDYYDDYYKLEKVIADIIKTF